MRQYISFNHVVNSHTSHNIDRLIIVAKNRFAVSKIHAYVYTYIPVCVEKCNHVCHIMIFSLQSRYSHKYYSIYLILVAIFISMSKEADDWLCYINGWIYGTVTPLFVLALYLHYYLYRERSNLWYIIARCKYLSMHIALYIVANTMHVAKEWFVACGAFKMYYIIKPSTMTIYNL